MTCDSGYIGCDLSEDDYEITMATKWDKSLVREELGLFSRKSFDYRHLHPVQATYYFAHVFVEQTRSIIRKHIDNTPPKVLNSGKTKDWNPLKTGDVFEPPSDPKKAKSWKSKTKSLIKARQTADRLGIPYEFFISKGLRSYYFGRYYLFENEGKRTLPTPEMFTTEDCLVSIADAWLQELDSRIHHATHPRYLIENDCGHTDVSEHQTSLLSQISRKSDPTPALRKFLAMGLLSEERIEARFGAERLQKVLESVAKK
jgi:hypothetical protein